MRAIILLLAGWSLVLPPVFAQGTVYFNNRLTALGLDAPFVFYNGLGPGPAYSAGLYYRGGNVLQSVTTFRDGTSNPILGRYINSLTVAIPGTLVGQRDVPVEMRVWLTAAGSYEAAPEWARYRSGELIISELGGGPDPRVANHLPVTFKVWPYLIPEPSTPALGVLGAVATMISWKKRLHS